MRYIMPVPGYYVVHPGGHYDSWRTYGLHGGVDYPAPAVDTVSIAAGSTIFAGRAGDCGRTVWIQFNDGTRAHYCHLSSIAVVAGQAVAQGTVIGKVGGSGSTGDYDYGSHLHLNLFFPSPPTDGPSHYVPWVGMYAVDPELYLGQEDDNGQDEMEEDDMLRAIREAGTRAIYVSDGLFKRPVHTTAQLDDMRQAGLVAPGVKTVSSTTWDRLLTLDTDLFR